jgi:integrase
MHALNSSVWTHQFKVDRVLVPRNVATLVDAPKVEAYEPTLLTPAQAQQFLDAATSDRLEALYHVALSLGLREGETLGLRWQDVGLDAGTLRVAVALQPIHGKLVFVKPKTAKSQRTLPLPPPFVSILHQHKAWQLEERLLAGSSWREHDLVFPSRVGTPIHPSNLLRSFAALLKRAGLPRMRFHDLRHSCATFLALQGVPPHVAMEILGHSNIHTTLSIYTHVLDDSKREALNALGQLFKRADIELT